MADSMHSGFIRDSLRRLVVVAAGAGLLETMDNGFVRDEKRRLIVVGPEGVPIGGAFKSVGEVSGAVTLDLTQATSFSAKLKGATEFQFSSVPTNPTRVSLAVEQDATGGRNWSIKGVSWLGGSEPAFQTTAGKRYVVEMELVNGEIRATAQPEPSDTVTAVLGSQIVIKETTTLQDITGVSLPITASPTELWRLTMWIVAGAPNSTMDMKLGFSVPTGCTLEWGSNAGGTNVAGFSGAGEASVPTGLLSESETMAIGSPSGKTFGVGLVAIVHGGGTAGNVQPRFAQNTSNASNLTLRVGTVLEARRIRN